MALIETGDTIKQAGDKIETAIANKATAYATRAAAAAAITAGDLTSGQTFEVPGQGSFVIDGTGTAFDDQSSGLGVSAVSDLSQRLTPDQFGAAGDGVTDEEAIILRAMAASTKPLKIPPKSYLLSSSRPRLQDYAGGVDPEPGSLLSVALNPQMWALKIHRPLATEDPALSTRDHTFLPNQNRDIPLLSVALGASRREGAYAATVEDWTTWDNNFVPTSTNVPAAGTATVTATSVTWASEPASNLNGVYKSAQPGDWYECTILRNADAAGTPSSHFVAVDCLFATNQRLYVQFREEDLDVKVAHITSGGSLTTLATVTLPHLTYSLEVGGSLTLGIRQISATQVEVYSNDLLIYTVDTAGYGGGALTKVGFATTKGLADSIELKDPVKIGRGYTPTSKPNLSIAVIGDSISQGAWTSITWPDQMADALEASGIAGNVSVTNMAVSGASAQTWVAGGVYSGDGASTSYGPIASVDFTPYDLVLVQLGTNDAIGDLNIATFKSNMQAIGDAIVADGALPVFGLPIRANDSQAGSERLAEYVGAARTVAATNGWTLAPIRAGYGCVDQFFDNLHPHEYGQAHIASAWARAVISLHRGGAFGTPATWVAGAEYTLANDATDRSVDPAAITGLTVSGTYTQAEVEALRDAVGALADTVATMVRDLDAAGILKA